MEYKKHRRVQSRIVVTVQKQKYREEKGNTFMKVVILAGGLGTRISEESHLKPKPMIEIGGRPILWHIMKYYSEFGFHDFVICLGYKQYVVKEFFADYFLHTSDVTFDLANNKMEVHNNYAEPWKVTLVDTGLHTMTGGRVKRIQPYIGDEPFMLTYGDGVCNVDLEALVKFHKSHGRIATITTVNIGQQKGVLDIGPDNVIRSFREKSDSDGAVINGGFMVMNPQFFTTSLTSCSSIPKRISGLSEPNLSIASCHVIRWIGSFTSMSSTSLNRYARNLSFTSITSSTSTKESSISICVNSGCLSARRSSSRKHLAI